MPARATLEHPGRSRSPDPRLRLPARPGAEDAGAPQMVFTTDWMGISMGAVRDARVPRRAERVGGPGAFGRRARTVVFATLAVGALWLATAATASAFSAAGSVEQVYATGLAPGAEASLLQAKGKTVSTVATQTADAEGGLLFRHVTPGKGYAVKLDPSGPEVGGLTVHKQTPAPWDSKIYKQSIPTSGYGYLTTRDGTQLAYDVHPPGVSLNADPFGPAAKKPAQVPTLIEYAGYGYANPNGPESGLATLANLMGFAVVDVNMRGTGCSGGAFDYFEPLQNLDAYDVIETVAHQPWVLNHKVGLFGISYGGISQLFAAQLRPKGLAAIAPLSVLDATATTLYPGGVLNTGFAVAWAEDRQFDAEPAGPSEGEHWAYEQIQKGDTTCAANQNLHGEASNLLGEIKENSTYNPAVADSLDPITFVNKIKVPTFLACQFEDEQTGGHCANLVSHFTGTKRKWFTFVNGVHADSLDPYTFDRLYDFLELYVAHQAPMTNAGTVHGLAPEIYSAALGLPKGDQITLPPDTIQEQSNYMKALKAFQGLPEVRVLFDNGAGTAPAGGTTAAGNPYPGFEDTFPEFPSGNERVWYLGAGGTLTELPAASEGVDSYTSDANATALTDYTGGTGPGGLWGNASQWLWNWEQPTEGKAVSYVSEPLGADTTIVGGGAVNLWVKSSTPDVDLQATVSEVRTDGNETFVQNGWIRASQRKLATNSENMFKQAPTGLEPIPTFLASDVQPMPAGEFVPVTIPLYFEGHVYRAGSHIRITIAAPNGSQPVWSFNQTQPENTTSNVSIAFGPTMHSDVVLPEVSDEKVPTGLPACPSLRNEPCRPYQALVNNGS